MRWIKLTIILILIGAIGLTYYLANQDLKININNFLRNSTSFTKPALEKIGEKSKLITKPFSYEFKSTKLISTDSSKEINWIIEKSGIEENLEIIPRKLNETSTEFCINFLNKTEYLKTGANNIPIQKTSKDTSFSLEKSNIDLSKENCFIVNYLEEKEGISFKIGNNTILINSTIDNDATEGTGRNIFRDIYGGLNVAYTSNRNDIGFARSSDNGNTWISNEILAGSFDDTGITGNSTGGLLLYWRDTADVDGIFSTDNGTTWSSATTLMDITDALLEPSCKVDGNGLYHCCSVDNTAYKVYYTNSSGWNSELLLYTSAALVRCDIEVGEDNCVYVLIGEQAGTDSLIMTSSCTNWDTSDVIASGMVFNPHITLSVINTTEGTEILLAGYGDQNTNSIHVCSWIGGWDCQNVSQPFSFFPEMAVNKDFMITLISGNSSGSGGSTIIMNSSDAINWNSSIMNLNADFASIADETFPPTARITNVTHIVFTNETGIYYGSYELITNETSSCSCPTINTDWIADLSEYCIITTPCEIGTGNLSFIDTGNFTCNTNINISNLNRTGLNPSNTLWIQSNCRMNTG